MPHFLLNNGTKPDLPAIWNVDASVGKGGTNALNDVYLVQYLLKMIGKANKIPKHAALCNKLSQVLTTGSCDAYTISCITDYQTMLNYFNTKTAVDGRVSRSTAAYYYDSSWYTIVLLNKDYQYGYFHNWPCIDCDSVSRPLAVRDMCYQNLYGEKPVYSTS